MIRFLIFLVLTNLFLQPVIGQVQPKTVVISSEETDLSPIISIIDETGKNYVFEEVSSGKLDSLFTKNEVKETGQKKWERSIWAKINLRTKNSETTSWIIKTDKLYGHVTCFMVYQNGKTVVQESGWDLPPSQRGVKGPDVIFKLLVPDKETVSVYFHVVTNLRWSTLDSLNAKIIAADSWYTNKWHDYAFLLFYAGICLLATFYWLIMFLYSLQANYIYLIAAVISPVLFYAHAFGLLSSLILGQVPLYYLDKYGESFFWLPFLVISTAQLVIKLNDFKAVLPKLNSYFVFMLWLDITANFILPVFVNWKVAHNICYVLTLTTGTFGFFMLLHMGLTKKRKNAVFAFISYFPMLSGSYAFYLYDLGLLPDTFASKIIGPAGALITVVMLFYGMITYVRALRKKREKELKEKQELIEEQNTMLERKVEERTSELNIEKKKTEDLLKKSDELLLNILPAEVAEELKHKGSSAARDFELVTVMFTDFKDFTKISEQLSPAKLVEEIDHCFSAFDNIIHKYGVEKIKTIGDAYMCVGGLPVKNSTHAVDIVNAALEILDFIRKHNLEKRAKGETLFEIRIGINTGSVVAGIVGVKKFAYDIWGDTVNIASRMESSGESGKVNISGTTYELVKDNFKCTHRGKLNAKNKGEVDMYFVQSSLLKGVNIEQVEKHAI